MNIYNAKSILLGDPAVGKTSLRRTYMGNSFSTSHLTTIGADFATKNIQTDKNDLVKMQIWDINGDETIHSDPTTFNLIRSKYLINSNICLMVFDLTRQQTFKNVHMWLEEFWKVNQGPDIPLLLIGNKADLIDQRTVEQDAIENMIEVLRGYKSTNSKFVSYITTSAATGLNIETAFQKVSSQLVKICQ